MIASNETLLSNSLPWTAYKSGRTTVLAMASAMLEVIPNPNQSMKKHSSMRKSRYDPSCEYHSPMSIIMGINHRADTILKCSLRWDGASCGWCCGANEDAEQLPAMTMLLQHVIVYHLRAFLMRNNSCNYGGFLYRDSSYPQLPLCAYSEGMIYSPNDK